MPLTPSEVAYGGVAGIRASFGTNLLGGTKPF
jgi:hypothetical protein